MKSVIENLVRWRTWIANLFLAAMFVLPEIINSPEFLAVIPHEYQRWFLVAAFLANIALRPRPAALTKEVQARAAATPEPYEHM